ncbi:MAG: carboxylesterase [Zunongwangia sp.]|uniref:alpha/beta hydrolase n=1 Tax=Flavobacteriaceae TaxID=49546 RepID=UPI000C8A5EE2|nr:MULTISPECIES: alpha/beta hydrolase [Flavobacteriaceae]MAG88550.1 carboxylesterase [Flavobacteriaceae bacterium]MAN25715.1 carboxylesterase [Mesonia sp.]MAO36823.1 carboxylesterase [Zunongwangia sp.]MCC4230257.1 alpha/beta hydrolase [Zunongwangia profunda]|tara:strand:+ start:4984 stop:5976 length:993 start_codon:yes stop_codon:yes gene_type:complete
MKRYTTILLLLLGVWKGKAQKDVTNKTFTMTPEVQKVLNYIKAIEVPENEKPWITGRLFYEKMNPLAGKKEQVFKIENRIITLKKDTVPVRIYSPNNQKGLPIIIYFHGGWFKGGSLETHDSPLRQLANLSQAVIISVDYRLAPEHPFPAGIEDSFTVVAWVLMNTKELNVDKNQITIMGDSAGGAIAATVSNRFSNEIAKQVLIYPATDNSLKTNSWNLFKNGPILNIKEAKEAWSYYLPDEKNHENPDAIPLKRESFSNLPPTFIATAQYDPLRDEALLYAEKLVNNNVAVTQKNYGNMIHGFFQMGAYLKESRELMQDIVNFINDSE